jgi:hypothetical protein
MPFSKYMKDPEDDEFASGSGNVMVDSVPVQPEMPAKLGTSSPLRPLAPSFSASELNTASVCSDPEAFLAPYISRRTLKCLDPEMLERNIQVRHDLMLDSSFKASVPKNANDSVLREDYWASIRLELAELPLEDEFEAPRLKRLISEIREVMLELYPRCDLVRSEMVELMDEEHIIQQIKHGVFDAIGFFEFLAAAMKKNCAPKRDFLVDSMVACARIGEVMQGMETCLDLLELMKLDLANYRLDVLRPAVSKTAITTERAYFANLLTTNRLPLSLTEKWLKSAAKNTSGGEHEVFLEAALCLLVNPFVRDTSVPEAFVLDKRRLLSLHSSFQDMCIVQCMLLIFKQMTGNTIARAQVDQLKKELFTKLSQPDTQISGISELLAKHVATTKGLSVMTDTMVSRVHSYINKIITPDNSLFLLVEKKLVDHVRLAMLQQPTAPASTGLTECNVLDNLCELESKFHPMITYNWHVFEPIYSQLIKKIRRA